MKGQLTSIRKNPSIIVATPGRLIDHLEQKTLNLSDVRILVLDEADRMLDMGFAPQIDRVLRSVPKRRQTMLFSATIPPSIVKIASTNMKLPVHLEIAPSGTTAEKVTQELFIVKRESKNKILRKILDQYRGSVLIFSRTRRGATRVNKSIKGMGHKSAEIHSDRTLGQRRQALEGFKSGAYRILVATDIAARGIDVTGIELVVNYDLPDDAGNYVHRIGRTGRATHTGHAISFATPEQRNEVKEIEEIIRTAIPISEHPELPIESFAKPQKVFSSRRYKKAGVPRRRR
jgi:ATP-dependent RNA helicase RhlE